MAELPAARAERLQAEAGLSADSAHALAFRGELGDFFEAALARRRREIEPQALANWLTVELAPAAGRGRGPSGLARHARRRWPRWSGSSRPSR